MYMEVIRPPRILVGKRQLIQNIQFMKNHLFGASLRTLAAAGLLLFSQADSFSQINVGANNGFGAPMASALAGDYNTNNGTYSSIGGGFYNLIDFGSDWAFIGDGQNNTIMVKSPYSVIGGGNGNTIFDYNYASVIGGGAGNGISPNLFFSTIGGGAKNTTFQHFTTIGGGEANMASQQHATVAGGFGNGAGGFASFIGGGTNNRAMDYAVIGGGVLNQAVGRASTVGGGDNNKSVGDWSAITGGAFNNAQGVLSAIGGGRNNSAIGGSSVIPGGSRNFAYGSHDTVAGGLGNIASNTVSTVGGGLQNSALSFGSTIAGGINAQATNYGQQAYSSGRFANNGDAQNSTYVLRRSTSAPGWNELFLDGVSQRMHISPGATWTFDVLIAAQSTTGDSAGYRFYGVIENVGGITSFVGAVAAITQGEDIPAWNAQVFADNVNDSLGIRVMGTSGNAVRWVATVRTVEAKF